jgi:hypothetical protein
VKFEYDSVVSVKSLEITWDLCWVLVDDGEVSKSRMNLINKFLTAAAIEALNKKDTSIWNEAAEKWADYGAADSEPYWQFEKLWNEAYGEAI